MKKTIRIHGSIWHKDVLEADSSMNELETQKYWSGSGMLINETKKELLLLIMTNLMA